MLYFTPIHPIGTEQPQGQEQFAQGWRPTIRAAPTPSASDEGGHDAVHPQLGTLDGFPTGWSTRAKAHGMEIALDFAVQCSPDHPWLKRPSGMVQAPRPTERYATPRTRRRNTRTSSIPDFYCDDRVALWDGVARHLAVLGRSRRAHLSRRQSAHQAVSVLGMADRARFAGAISDVDFSVGGVHPSQGNEGARQARLHPVLHLFHLAHDQDGVSGLSHRAHAAIPNASISVRISSSTTPDILPVQLQTGETWMFKSRVALAATLSSNYGIYNGFELLEHEPIPGKEEYLNSEKYEIKTRDWNKPGQYQGLSRPAEPNSARQHRAAADRQSALSAGRGRHRHRLHEEIGRRRQCGRVRHRAVGDTRAILAPFRRCRRSGQPASRFGRSKTSSTGERRMLEWGGVRLWIDPADDPAMLFRCLA